MLLLATVGLLFSPFSLGLDPERSLDQYHRKTFDLAQGLPQVSITAIAQDSRGFLWLGTQDGLARFDGLQFDAFNTRNTKGMNSDVVVDVMFDDQQKLWLLSYDGLGILDKGGLKSVVDPSFPVKTATDLDINEQGTFACAMNGLFKLQGSKLHPYLYDQPCFVVKTSGHGLVIGGRGKIFYIRDEQITEQPLPAQYSRAKVNDLLLNAGQYYIATNQGLLRYDGHQFYTLPAPKGYQRETINHLYLDENNILWVAGRNTLYRLSNNHLLSIDTPPEMDKITKIFRDREGSLWLGTNNRGLIQLWDSWSAGYGKRQGLDQELVWSLANHNNERLLIGTDNGLYQFKGNRVKPFINTALLPDPSVYSLFVDNDQSVWTGTKSGLAHFDSTGKIINEDFGILAGIQVNGAFRDSDGRLWVLTQDGVFVGKNNHLEMLPLNGDATSVSFRAGLQFQDKIWLASQNGLFSYEPKSGLRAVDNIPKGYFYTSLLSFDNKLIVGSYSHGLWIFDGKKWTNLTTKEGLIFNNSFSLQNKPPYIYVSGFDGVYRFPLVEFSSFGSAQTQQISAQPILDDKGLLPGSQKAYCCNGAGHGRVALFSGNLWYPTRAGALKLEPDKIEKNHALVVTQIQVIKSGDQTIELYFDPKIPGQFEQRNLSIQYAGVTSLDQGLVTYRYRLIKLDQSDNSPWVEAGNRREAFFTNLSGGDYRFEVKARNNAGLWPHLPSSIEFSIALRWYEYSVVRFLFGLLLLCCIYAVYRFEHFRALRKEKHLQIKIAEKTEALQDTNQRLEKAIRQLEFYSFTDSLTGTNNRRYIEQQIPSDIAHYLRNSASNLEERSLAFILIDIDFFKKVNDQYGHPTGDEVLRQIAALLRAGIRDGDYLIRWGGEEFLIVLRPEHVVSIELVCHRILDRVRRREFYGVNNEQLRMSISLGFSLYPLEPELAAIWSWKDAVEMADKALYLAKNNGRDTWFGYQFELQKMQVLAPPLLKKNIISRDPAIFKLVRADSSSIDNSSIDNSSKNKGE